MSEISSTDRPSGSLRTRRASILVRLLIAFAVVSFLPIAVLAALSLQEAATEAQPHQEAVGGSEAAESAEAAEAAGGQGTGEAAGSAHGTIFGVPTEYVELGVAGASVVLSIGAALYIRRTIIRPVRALESSMHRVESGDLDVEAAVTSDDEIGHLATSFNRMTAGLRREAIVRDLFGQYVSPEVARLAIDRHGQLEPVIAECTVLFVDIRRFTALAEVLPPARLIGTLNRYFEAMLAEVEAEGGIVNKFGGDSLLAVFGSPLNPMADHAARAVRAALRMLDALAAFNREEAALELPQLRVGYGIATGELVAGNVGSSRKLEYTVIGDPVNLAARLQELTPQLGEDVLVSARTAELAGDAATFRSLGRVEIRGRAGASEVFAASPSPSLPSKPEALASSGS